MAKRGIPAKLPSHRSIWRRGLVLAAFTLMSGVCMTWFAMRELAPVSPPVRLSRLSDVELEPHLRALIRQGRAKLARVVESLGAERLALQSAASRTLHEEIDRCARAGSDEAALQLDEIAGVLATHAPQLDADALTTAAALAERILAVPMLAGSASNRLRHCHVVLKEEAERRMKEQAGLPARMSKNTSGQHQRAMDPGPASRTGVSVTVAPLVGGGLAVAPSDAQPRRLPPQVTRQAKQLNTPDATPRTAATASQLNLPSRIQAAGSESQANGVTDVTAVGHPTAAGNASQSRMQTANANVVRSSTAERAQAPIPRDLARLLELAERVRIGSSSPSAAMKAELQWLGIDEVQLRLARGAIDDDPRVRQEVVEALAQVGTVDARGWLLWLSHDHDAEVRRAAISLLATASDPELKKRVRQAAASDNDPRVRQQAQAAITAGEARPSSGVR
jgi:HEAT repeats